MGAAPYYEGDEIPPDVERWLRHDSADPEEPIESNVDGCPGGWYRNEFFQSVMRYARPCAEGVYSPNIRLELMLRERPDQLIIDAVTYYETEQARARRWYYEGEAKIRASQQK